VVAHGHVHEHGVRRRVRRRVGRHVRRPAVGFAAVPQHLRDREQLHAAGPRAGYAIPTIPSFPYTESAIVYWDGGPQTPVAPTLNIPNRDGADPHAFPRSTAAALQQKSDFLVNGVVDDVCGTAPCHTDNYG
jgi:hypothetical protein